jgi:hypothetical protein
MKNKIIKGMFWHCHHDRLCEYVWDYQERVDYIKNNKPKNEIETRLKLFKKIKGKLPKKWEEAYAKWKEACAKWEEVDVKWEEVGAKYLPELEKLHKKECGCKEWNGKKLVFEK